ncbi:tandem-95 repeat protein [Eionea flava]
MSLKNNVTGSNIAKVEFIHGDVTAYRSINNSINAFALNEESIIYENDFISTSSDSSILLNSDGTPIFLSSLESLQLSSNTLTTLQSIYNQASSSFNGNPISFSDLQEALSSQQSIESLLENPSATFREISESISLYGKSIILWPRENPEIIPDNDISQSFLQSILSTINDEESLRKEAEFFVEPTANNDEYFLNEDSPLSNINVLSNDVFMGENPINQYDNTSANGGIVTLNSNNTFSYTPVNNFNGIDTFTYTITGNAGQKITATVTLYIKPVSDGSPQANDDTVSIEEDNSIVIDFSKNDILPDEAELLNYSQNSINNGQVSYNSDGTFTYTPANNYNGTDTFSYTIKDSDGETDTGTITINVTPVSDGTPAALDDHINSLEDTSINITPLANDTIFDEAAIIDFQTTSLQGGTVSETSEGVLTYTPSANYFGTDSFTYTIQDSDGQSSTATIFITIEEVNDKPVNNLPDNVSVLRNQQLNFSEANDYLITLSDVDENITTAELSVSQGTLNIISAEVVILGNDTGNLSISGTQAAINNALSTLTYQPNTGFGGFDTLNIQTTDSKNATDTDSLTIKVTVTPSAVSFNEGIGQPPASTGLTATQYTANTIYDESHLALDDSSSIESDIAANATTFNASRMTEGVGALAQTTVIDTSNSIQLGDMDGDVYALTGLIYLEAGSEYRFAGSRDDALYIELGGQTMVSTAGDSAGYFSTRVSDNTEGLTENIFTPTVSGYYTLEVYAANLLGLGELALNFSQDDIDYLLSANNFSFFANAKEVISAGGLIDAFTSNTSVGENPDGGYFAHNGNVDVIGIEGQTIKLTNFSIDLAPDDTLISLIMEIPEGSTLYGALGEIFVATAGNNTIDLIANNWSLKDLSLSLPDASAGELVDLFVSATTQTVSLDTLQSDHTLSVSILPEGFTGTIDSAITKDSINTGNDDVITGSGFNDVLTSAPTGNTVILGLNGDDTLTGNDNNNTLFGGNGNDIITSGAGNDMIFGGQGSDTLIGGVGIDHFIWKNNDADGSTDTIEQFTLGNGGDLLDLSQLLEGETTNTLTNFIQLSGSTLNIDSNGDGSGFDDLFIDISDLGSTSLESLIEHNIIYDSGRSILRGTEEQNQISGRQSNGITTNEDFFGNGGGDDFWGNGGADRYIVEGDDFVEFIPTPEEPNFSTLRIKDLFTFGNFDGVSEADAIDLSRILAGENYTNIHNYLTIDTRFSFGGTMIEVDIDGNGSGTDFEIHIQQDNLDIEAELGYTDDTNQLEILQLLIDYGNIVID